jgi:hypothetical protein
MQRGALVKNGPDGGVDWIWLWHDGKLTPVAPAPPNQTAQYEDYATGIQWPLRPSQVKVSSNGNLLFSTISGQGLVGYDHGSCNTGLGIGCRELYLYSAATGQVACVSCIPSGAPGEGEGAGRMSTLQFGNTSDSITGGTKADRPNWLPLSRDGSRVFFSTTQALVPEDTNGKFDAYEYDVKTGQVHLLSSGTSKYDSYFVNADAEGRNVFIVTNQQLLGWDHDQGYDVYDARVNGGFPEPLPVPAPCNGESCHRSLPPNPSVPSIGSSLEGPGNPKQQRPPKKKHHHRRRHHRAARANRRVAR